MRRTVRVPVLLVLGGLAWAATHWAVHRAVAAGPAGHDDHAAAGAGSLAPGYLSASLSLCLALALLIAAGASLRDGRMRSTRSLWLFGIVPVLGLAGEIVAAPPTSLAQAGSLLAELGPVLLVVAVVQAAVALVAVRFAHGVLDFAESLARTIVGPLVAHADAVRLLHSSLPGASPRPAPVRLGGGQRAPPVR